MHCFELNILYRLLSLGSLVMKDVLVVRRSNIAIIGNILSIVTHIATCTKYPIGSNVLWEGHSILDGWMDGWMDGQTEGRTDGWSCSVLLLAYTM